MPLAQHFRHPATVVTLAELRVCKLTGEPGPFEQFRDEPANQEVNLLLGFLAEDLVLYPELESIEPIPGHLDEVCPVVARQRVAKAAESPDLLQRQPFIFSPGVSRPGLCRTHSPDTSMERVEITILPGRWPGIRLLHMLKLYHFPFAPNPGRVLAYLKEKQVDGVEYVYVDFTKGEQNSPEHRNRNPRGIAPLLEFEDGRILAETVPIIEYLEERYPDPVMIGSSPEERALTRSTERDIELNVLTRTVSLVHATRSPLGLPPNPDVARIEREKLPIALSRVDSIIGGNRFVMGDRPSIADCTLLAALNFSKFGELELEASYPNIRRWYADYAERQAELPEILQ